MFCFVRLGSRVFFEKTTSNELPSKECCSEQYQIPPPPHPPKETWKIIFRFRAFSTGKKDNGTLCPWWVFTKQKRYPKCLRLKLLSFSVVFVEDMTCLFIQGCRLEWSRVKYNIYIALNICELEAWICWRVMHWYTKGIFIFDSMQVSDGVV